MTKYTSFITSSGLKALLPNDVYEQENLIEISTIGSPWAQFLNQATGEIYDCREEYNKYIDDILRKDT